jgi:hypothetical protein
MAEAFNSVELPSDKAARYAALEGEPGLTAPARSRESLVPAG